MGSFARTKTADPPNAAAPASAGKKIVLHMDGKSSTGIMEMAAQTLQSGGFDVEEANKPKPVEIGGKMPDGTVYAGISPDTGKAMYTTPADAPLIYTFNEAKEYAVSLDPYGHRNWRVPTKSELNVLFNNRAAIGGFDLTGSYPSGWYWSASLQHRTWHRWDQRFSDGFQDTNLSDFRSSVRCVC